MRRIRRFINGFFPLRLILSHLRYNFLLCLYWAFLFGVVLDKIASNYGLPYLFLSPEYNGKVSWLSFFFLGLGLGGFSIAFNIYSYMKLGRVFPFVSTLARPFYKFCINNSLIPIAFGTTYIICMTRFQLVEELAPLWEIVLFNFSFLFGFFIYFALSFLYFFPTNKDVYKYTGEKYTGLEAEPISSMFHKDSDWTEIADEDYKKYIYMQNFLKLRLSRPLHHYDKLSLEKVFAQNYINATLFELVTIISFFIIGLFKSVSYFQVPAGMSILLLLTVILMIFSIFASWMKGWVYPFMIIAFLSINFLSTYIPILRYDTYVYGLDYSSNKIKNYDIETINKTANDSLRNESSFQNILSILNHWEIKTKERKPKLVLMMTSGGGLRSAVWTYEVMNYLDSVSDHKFGQNLHMITGASGGMVGASYYRSLLLEKKTNNHFKWDTDHFRTNISNDLLNHLSLSASVNDLFLRFASFTYKDKKYTKDRAFAFESQLNTNTEGLLGKELHYFYPYERDAEIPLIIFSPTIVNDGRRLLICSQPLSFMAKDRSSLGMEDSHENIDIHSFFENNSTNDIKLSTAIRMSATFPYILPMTSLPTSPKMNVMDAGLRDNYGNKIMIEYIETFKKWIQENTSGVIIVQIRDKKKILRDQEISTINLPGKLLVPLTVMPKNFTRTQDFDAEELWKFLIPTYDFPIDIVTYNLTVTQKTPISLSWHLTEREKKFIKYAIYSEENQQEATRFLHLISSDQHSNE